MIHINIRRKKEQKNREGRQETRQTLSMKVSDLASRVEGSQKVEGMRYQYGGSVKSNPPA